MLAPIHCCFCAMCCVWRWRHLLYRSGGDWQRPDISTFITGFLAHFVWLVAILKAFEFGIGAGAVALIAAMQPVLMGFLAPLLLGEKNN